MKRCPECEFLYEDEQECCDMDGTVLRLTSFLPPSPESTARSDRKSIWGELAIPLLALIVIGSVLVTLYRAAPKFSSSSAPKNQPAGTNKGTKQPVSDSPQLGTSPAIPATPAERSSVPATPAQNAAANSTRLVQSSNEKRLSVEPATRDPFEAPSLVVNAPKAAPSQTSRPAPASPKAATGSRTISVHPEPPPAKPAPAPQPKTQNQGKDSKVKSLFKKAGRVLKKPF